MCSLLLYLVCDGDSDSEGGHWHTGTLTHWSVLSAVPLSFPSKWRPRLRRTTASRSSRRSSPPRRSGDILQHIHFIYTIWGVYGNLFAKETSYLKTPSFRSRCPEWMPNLPSDCGWDSNPCTLGSLGPLKARGCTVLNCNHYTLSMLCVLREV